MKLSLNLLSKTGKRREGSLDGLPFDVDWDNTSAKRRSCLRALGKISHTNKIRNGDRYDEDLGCFVLFVRKAVSFV